MKQYSLQEIFEQAQEDKSSIYCTMSRGESFLNMGVKLQKFIDYIEILNCSKGGDYFQELTETEYEVFFNNGWKRGCVITAMNNCLHKLDLIENKMKVEVNTRKNDKHIQNLKTRREGILNRYSKHKIKLIKLK